MNDVTQEPIQLTRNIILIKGEARKCEPSFSTCRGQDILINIIYFHMPKCRIDVNSAELREFLTYCLVNEKEKQTNYTQI